MPQHFNYIRICAISLLIFCASFCNAQLEQSAITPNNNGLQYGFSIKASIELPAKKDEPCPMFRIAANAGVASFFLGDWMYPAVNGEIMLYRGGIGAKGRTDKPLLFADATLALTATAGALKTRSVLNNAVRGMRNIPLYYFSDHVFPALQNPFETSLSLGTNFVYSVERRSVQQVGFLNGHHNMVQLSYYNDGAFPFSTLRLGDAFDRYYTGGGIVSFHGAPNTFLNLIEISYKKFTGFTLSAFEASNKMNLPYVVYKRQGETAYNKSVWGLNLANATGGYGMRLNYYNSIKYDAQHMIHWGRFDSYHIVPYKGFVSIAGSYYHINQNMGSL